MTASALTVHDLAAGYGPIQVLSGVNLRVDPGEIVGLLGANGAGKTTTLLAICGAIKPSAGTVTLMGEPVTGSAPHQLARLGLGFVPDDRALIPSLSVRESFSLVRSAPVDPTSFFDELLPLLSRSIGTLSGGEQQMVAIARCLAAAPRVLLLDELSQGLAPLIVKRILTVLRRTADETGLACLLVEQQVKECLQVSNRTYVMASGTVALEGLSKDLLEDPELLMSTYLGATQERHATN